MSLTIAITTPAPPDAGFWVDISIWLILVHWYQGAGGPDHMIRICCSILQDPAHVHRVSEGDSWEHVDILKNQAKEGGRIKVASKKDVAETKPYLHPLRVDSRSCKSSCGLGCWRSSASYTENFITKKFTLVNSTIHSCSSALGSHIFDSIIFDYFYLLLDFM